MAYEPSEIMFAASLLYSNKLLDEQSKTVEGLSNLMVDARERVKKLSGKHIHFGNSSIQDGFLTLMDEKDPKKIKDLAAGISAAKGLKSDVGIRDDVIPQIYMTGNVWPDTVKKFQVSAYGMADYNSSDVIVSPDNKTFYGVSLKKKDKPKAPDPTLINKAFDTIFDGTGATGQQLQQIKELKAEVETARLEYFSGLIREAVDLGIFNWKDINGPTGVPFKTKKEFDTWANTTNGKKELFNPTKKNKALFGKYSYIDTKGYATHPQGYLADASKTPFNPANKEKNSMRSFVNSRLSNTNSPIWKSFSKIIDDHVDLFADTLMTLILKSKLYKQLEAKDLNNLKFEFYLATAMAMITPDVKAVNNQLTEGKVTIQHAHYVSLKTTLCGLTRIENKFKGKPYKIVPNTLKQDASSAAKMFFQLKRGEFVILDLELRYKGSFNPQPQFQATINESFKKLLETECGV